MYANSRHPQAFSRFFNRNLHAESSMCRKNLFVNALNRPEYNPDMNSEPKPQPIGFRIDHELMAHIIRALPRAVEPVYAPKCEAPKGEVK